MKRSLWEHKAPYGNEVASLMKFNYAVSRTLYFMRAQLVLHIATQLLHIDTVDTSYCNATAYTAILLKAGVIVRNDKLSVQSMDFAVSIIDLVKELKLKKDSIIANQIGRSGTSIGANIREANYAHSRADFISKLQIALKEANETGYWFELLYKTDYIDENAYRKLDCACTSIRVMLIASINTAKARH